MRLGNIQSLELEDKYFVEKLRKSLLFGGNGIRLAQFMFFNWISNPSERKLISVANQVRASLCINIWYQHSDYSSFLPPNRLYMEQISPKVKSINALQPSAMRGRGLWSQSLLRNGETLQITEQNASRLIPVESLGEM